MYEMQGPLKDLLCEPTDCPGELVSWGNQQTNALSALPPVQGTSQNIRFPGHLTIAGLPVSRLSRFEVSSEWYPFSLVEKFYPAECPERKG